MLNIFSGIFDNSLTNVISVGSFLICILVSIVIGIILAVAYSYKNSSSTGFVMTLAMIPAVVCVVIMMVNGNVGAGVAVAGAFSLVRFRSAPGSAKEIGAIFIAMGAGLMTGMGYLAYAVLFAVILSLIMVIYEALFARMSQKHENARILHITIPENLDYSRVFDEEMDEFTEKWELTNVKTSNMGSMFKLTYDVILKDKSEEKKFIDRLRCKNGNLEISMAMQESSACEL